MGEVLRLLGVSFASALVPLVNIEVYLVGLGVLGAGGDVWTYAFVAAVGQMLGKLIWFYLGANALRWGWIRRKVEKPKAQAVLERWRERTTARPVVAATLVLVSAAAGVPPVAVVAVLAGQLRMNVVLFMVVGTAGRTLRFATFLGGAEWLSGAVTGWF